MRKLILILSVLAISYSIFGVSQSLAQSNPAPGDPNFDKVFCGDDEEVLEINTAVGCLKVGSNNEIAGTLIRIVAGIAGGVVLLKIAMGAFMIMTSAGEPNKIAEAKSQITSAITALLVITLSTLILRVFGVDILGLF